MQTAMRIGKRWTVSETLTLQREYELLEWNIQQIAVSHQRTVRAILFKLEQEGFITTWYEARGFDSSTLSTWRQAESIDDDEYGDDAKDEDYVDDGAEEEDDNDYDYEDEHSEVAKLTERVWGLETSVNDISNMMKQLFDSLLQKKSKKQKKSLRSTTTTH